MVEDERTHGAEIGARIAIARGKKSQPVFAEELGISKNTLLRYEKGHSVPDIVTVSKVCSLSGVDLDWLVNGEGRERLKDHSPEPKETALLPPPRVLEMPHPQPCTIDATGHVAIPRWQNPDPEMFDYVPLAEAQLSAGGGCFVLSEKVESYYAFRRNWLSRVASSTKNLVLMRVSGDSMHPTIQDSDTVMIDTGRVSIKEGMLYALRFDSTIMVKRLAFRPGGRILVISDNRQGYDPFETDVKNLHLIGQVIFFCRSFVPD